MTMWDTATSLLLTGSAAKVVGGSIRKTSFSDNNWSCQPAGLAAWLGLAGSQLASVAPDTFHIDHEAAALIDRMLQGSRPPKRPIYIDLVGVVTRLFTDVLAIEDRRVAAAIKFIRDHAC